MVYLSCVDTDFTEKAFNSSSEEDRKIEGNKEAIKHNLVIKSER